MIYTTVNIQAWRGLAYQRSCCRRKTEEDSLRRFWTNYCQDAERCQNTAWLILWETVGCGEAWSPTPSATHLMCVKRDQKMSSEMLPSHTWNNWATIKKHYTFIETIFEGKTQWDEQEVDRRASGNILSWAMWVAVYQNIRLWSGKGSVHNIRCGDGSRLIDLQMILTSYHLKFGCDFNVFWFSLFHSPSKILLLLYHPPTIV